MIFQSTAPHNGHIFWAVMGMNNVGTMTHAPHGFTTTITIANAVVDRLLKTDLFNVITILFRLKSEKPNGSLHFILSASLF